MRRNRLVDSNRPVKNVVNALLAEEFNHYLEHQDEYVEAYDGKVIVLKDKKVVGVYNSVGQAYWGAQEDYELGTFLIQKVSPGDTDTTVRTYSIV